eukprot:gb/GEZN01000844.1/.p1 GENE.gb/GEZN01000844.1/~~gb/GEZN01000844.1/.p1  ORF type:complete len:1049 (-),score=205.00 gb/GEZN01000844.1/:433-3579(-)
MLLWALLLLGCVWAMFEEQAGDIDWTLEHVGEVQHAVFNQPNRRVVVGTASNVVAALSTKTGEVLWRQPLPVHEALRGMAALTASKDEAVISLSCSMSGESALRAWRIKDGALLWDWGSTGPTPVSALGAPSLLEYHLRATMPPLARTQPAADLIVLGANSAKTVEVLAVTGGEGSEEVRGWSGQSGALLWSSPLPVQSGRVMSSLRLVGCGEAGAALLVLEWAGRRLELWAVDRETGKLSNAALPEQMVGLEFVSANQWVALEGYLVLRDQNQQQLHLVRLVCTQSAVTTELAHSLPISTAYAQASIQGLGEVGRRSPDVFIIKTQAKETMVRVLEGKLLLQETFSASLPGLLAAAPALSSASLASSAVLTASLSDSSLSLSVQNLTELGGAVETLAQSLTDFNGRGGVSRVFLDAFRKSSGSQHLGYRALVVMQDLSVNLVQGGRVVWCLEEALGSVMQVAFFGLPLASHFNEDTGFPSFMSRLQTAAKDVVALGVGLPANLKQIPSKLQTLIDKYKLPKVKLSAVAEGVKEGSPTTRDAFGLQQILLAVTSVGKLFGINTDSGELVWSKYIFNTQDAESWQLWKVVPINQHPLHAESVALCRRHNSSEFRLVYFNPINGKVSSTDSLELSSAAVAQAYPLVSATLDVHGHPTRALLLLDTNNRVLIRPFRADTWELFGPTVNKTFLFQLHDEAGGWSGLQGYSLETQGVDVRASDEAKVNALVAVPRWSFALPEQEAWAGLAMRDPQQHIQSQVKKTGKGDKVMWKYLNPNLLVLATVRKPPTQETIPSIKKPHDPAVTIYLLDLVTGHVLERVYHKQCAGPVHLVVAENKVIYHYWNVKHSRHEMSVLELYEDQELKENLKLGLGQSFSSYLEPNPNVLQQTFRFPHGSILALGTTTSLYGVTEREILLGLADGQIAALSHRYLDARRPLDTDNAAVNEAYLVEGLIPYETDLLMDDRKIISYNHSIPRLAGLASSQTGLESTSLVVGWGLDLFLVRVTPSGTFDLLDPDFNYELLVLTVVAVVATLIITNVLVERQTLADAWA